MEHAAQTIKRCLEVEGVGFEPPAFAGMPRVSAAA
jgi:hypothetical protein